MSRKKAAGARPVSRSVSDRRRDESNEPSTLHPPNPIALGWARASLGVAAVVSIYLAYTSLTGSGVVGCGGEDGCNEVLNSRWSKWLGIPVSLPAMALYLSLVRWSFIGFDPATKPPRRLARLGLRVGPWMVLGAAVWFFLLSAFVLNKFCPYCFAVHLTGSLGAVLLLKLIRATTTVADKSEGGVESWYSQIHWAALALGALIAGQLVYTPTTYRVASVSSNLGIAATDSTARRGPNSSEGSKHTPAGTTSEPSSSQSSRAGTEAIPSRVLALYDGHFQLDLYQLPLLGSVTAPKVLISQFDYTCEHCRHSHTPIIEAQQQFSNELAVVCLPMPIDGHCNEWIRKTPLAHTNACQFAALALALWQADRTKFHEFDDWMMTSPEALQVPVALARARSLVGEARLNQAFADPWVAQTLQLSISLYRSNSITVRSGAMPMLVAGTNVVTGTISSTANLLQLLDRSFGLKPAF